LAKHFSLLEKPPMGIGGRGVDKSKRYDSVAFGQALLYSKQLPDQGQGYNGAESTFTSDI
jgi:hypothetical protein